MVPMPACRIERCQPAPTVAASNGLRPNVFSTVGALLHFWHRTPPFASVVRRPGAKGSPPQDALVMWGFHGSRCIALAACCPDPTAVRGHVREAPSAGGSTKAY